MRKNNSLENIVIIPARKNSKRIKNKNIKFFFNKPLIYWTIKNVLNLKNISSIYVSTDCSRISKISKKFGAKVLFPRPKKLSGDKATILEVMKYEIKKLVKKKKINHIFCVLPTGIFLKKKHYIDALKKLDLKTNFVISAIKNEHENIKNFYFKNKKLKLINPEFEFTNTQKIPQTYKDAGQFYLAHSKTWLLAKRIFSKKTKLILLDKKKTVDIDNQKDWKLAIKIFKKQKLINSN